jgi:DNA-binding LacI/PurR family transcriptional regulator
MKKQKKLTVTIADVAQLAGVSTQTVSRVINQSTSVRPETRTRVSEAIEKLHFYPNRSAQNLQKQTVHAIGISIPFATAQIKQNPFYAEAISAVSSACAGEGFTLNVISWDTENKDAESIVRPFKERVISGVVLTSPDIEDAGILELRYHGIPFVVIGRPERDTGVTYVDSDNVEMARECTRYLIGLGHTRVLLVNGPSFMTYSEDLLKGYSLAHQESGIPLLNDMRIESNLLADDLLGREAELARLLEGATAAFTANDQLALALIRILANRGRRVPDDFSLVAGTDSFWTPFVTPALTAVQVDYAALARKATDLLLSMIVGGDRGKRPARLIFPARLVERSSCRRIACPVG